MKKKNFIIVYLFFIGVCVIACKENSELKNNNTNISSLAQDFDCENNLQQLLYTSDFEEKENYQVKVDEIRNDTIILKAFRMNNLSDNSENQQIVESAVGWFIIPPKKDALYLSLNALDPYEPNFKKIKTKEIFFEKFLNCNNIKKENNMTNEIQFTDLFNEGTIIKFTPFDLNNNQDSIIIEFKDKLKIYENQNPNKENFDIENLFFLINNETFFDLQYYIDSSWLEYFIEKYNIDTSKLNQLMKVAIEKEDYDAVKILIDNNYIVSEQDIKKGITTGNNSKENIEENKLDGYESYIVANSKIDSILKLIKKHFNDNRISDPDGYTNLRKEKNTTSEVLQKINSGEHIEVLDNSSDWFLIKTEEGKQGYVHKSRIKSD